MMIQHNQKPHPKIEVKSRYGNFVSRFPSIFILLALTTTAAASTGLLLLKVL